jgi:hypothetical protein
LSSTIVFPNTFIAMPDGNHAFLASPLFFHIHIHDRNSKP